MLKAENIESGYGPMQVLWGPSVHVKAGTITSLLGPNGSGKSTLLWTMLGSVKARSGSVTFEGKDVTDLPAHKKVYVGLTLVPEGKDLFKEMT
jgi:branched-chain amino acid transport system ATP-binding protein